VLQKKDWQMIEIDRPTFGLGYALTITPPPCRDKIFCQTGDTLHEIVKFGMDELTEGKKRYEYHTS